MTTAFPCGKVEKQEAKLQYSNSDLKNLVPLWQRELPNRVDKPVRDRILRRDVNVFGAPIREDALGNIGPLAQDIFGALLISQGAVKRTLN